MPRPSRLPEKRRELLPTVARAFAELGYRRATTAELARRCGVPDHGPDSRSNWRMNHRQISSVTLRRIRV